MKRLRSTAGLTLVELLITISLLVLVLMVVYFFGRYWQDNLTVGIGRSQMVSDANRALSRMSSELREIEPGESGQYPLEQADDFAITYYADTNHDGVIERVRYFLSGETLMRGVTPASGTTQGYDLTQEVLVAVTDFVVNGEEPLFHYYNANWPTDTELNPLQNERSLRTRFIRITLFIRPENLANIQPAVATQGVHLRTLKTNY
jgi:type II secretory pathway component PulJ